MAHDRRATSPRYRSLTIRTRATTTMLGELAAEQRPTSVLERGDPVRRGERSGGRTPLDVVSDVPWDRS
jgi:hypothetical protein